MLGFRTMGMIMMVCFGWLATVPGLMDVLIARAGDTSLTDWWASTPSGVAFVIIAFLVGISSGFEPGFSAGLPQDGRKGEVMFAVGTSVGLSGLAALAFFATQWLESARWLGMGLATLVGTLTLSFIVGLVFALSYRRDSAAEGGSPQEQTAPETAG